MCLVIISGIAASVGRDVARAASSSADAVPLAADVTGLTPAVRSAGGCDVVALWPSKPSGRQLASMNRGHVGLPWQPCTECSNAGRRDTTRPPIVSYVRSSKPVNETSLNKGRETGLESKGHLCRRYRQFFNQSL